MSEQTALAPTLPFLDEAMAVLTRQTGEPPAMRAWRLSAPEALRRLPFPRRDQEIWRRTDLSGLPFGQVRPALPGEGGPTRRRADLPAPARQALDRRVRRAGVLVQVGGRTALLTLSPEAQQAGVVLAPLTASSLPEGALERLGQALPPEEHWFSALNSALFAGGAFLRVPAGVRLRHPLHLLFLPSQGAEAIFPRLLMVLEEGASAVVVEEHLGPEAPEGPVLSVAVAEALVGPGARLVHIRAQDLHPSAFFLAFQRNRVAEGAFLQTLQADLGSRLLKTHLETVLEGPDARSEMLGLAAGNDAQHFDRFTLQDHRAPSTTSDLLYKGVLRDTARAIYYGEIHIARGAIKTDAYQQDRNLLMGGGPHAESIPVLEIEADDVRCSHGATVGPVDREHLFYLMSRGIPRPEAERLLVQAFLEEVLARIPVPWLQERLRARAQHKVVRD